MTAQTSTARMAGMLYLVIILCGMTAELALRGPLLAPGTAEGMLAAILAAPGLLRGAVLLDTVMVLADIGLAILLYRLLGRFGETAALAAMIFRLMQAAVIAASLLALVAIDIAALRHDTATAGAVGALMELHGIGYDVGLVFFAVNTALTAWLLWRSGLVARALPPLLGTAALVYLAGSLTRILAPELNAAIQPAYALPLVAEGWLALALLTGRRLGRAAV
ncbi:DUF4386 family protein [Rhodobacterales bacterium HKCCSP123]|nr:DUF4386 family protein [Rhodobacterales bacterium HKCCSP123]